MDESSKLAVTVIVVPFHLTIKCKHELCSDLVTILYQTVLYIRPFPGFGRRPLDLFAVRFEGNTLDIQRVQRPLCGETRRERLRRALPARPAPLLPPSPSAASPLSVRSRRGVATGKGSRRVSRRVRSGIEFGCEPDSVWKVVPLVCYASWTLLTRSRETGQSPAHLGHLERRRPACCERRSRTDCVVRSFLPAVFLPDSAACSRLLVSRLLRFSPCCLG